MKLTAAFGVLVFFACGGVTTAHDPRGTPPAMHEMIAQHDSACDLAVERKSRDAGETCVEAADEWAHIAAVQQLTQQAEYDSMFEAMSRFEASTGFHRVGKEKVAFDQAIMAAEIAISTLKTTKDEYIRRVAKTLIRAIYRRYPDAFEVK